MAPLQCLLPPVVAAIFIYIFRPVLLLFACREHIYITRVAGVFHKSYQFDCFQSAVYKLQLEPVVLAFITCWLFSLTSLTCFLHIQATVLLLLFLLSWWIFHIAIIQGSAVRTGHARKQRRGQCAWMATTEVWGNLLRIHMKNAQKCSI